LNNINKDFTDDGKLTVCYEAMCAIKSLVAERDQLLEELAKYRAHIDTFLLEII